MGLTKVGVAIVGLGRMGQLYARIVAEQPDCALRAVCGNSPGPVDALREQYGVPGYYRGEVGRMLDEHPDIDAVIVATPEWEHLSPALEVLRRRRHLLLEKPMAVSLVEADALAAAARMSGAVFMLCHVLRFDPRYGVLVEAAQSGAIGPIRRIRARRDASAEAFARVSGRFAPSYWLLPHDIDVVGWLIGRSPDRVQAQLLPKTGGLVAELRFGAEVVASLESWWLHPAKSGAPSLDELTVIGEGGRIMLQPEEQGLRIFSADRGPLSSASAFCRQVQGVLAGAFPEMIRHFLRCVHTGAQPAAGLAEGLWTMAVAAAIDESIRSGATVTPKAYAEEGESSCPSWR